MAYPPSLTTGGLPSVGVHTNACEGAVHLALSSLQIAAMRGSASGPERTCVTAFLTYCYCAKLDRGPTRFLHQQTGQSIRARSHRKSVANRNHNRQDINTWMGVTLGAAFALQLR